MYAITFFLLGGVVSTFACVLGTWWHLLHWFSLSFFAVSAAYAGLGPCVFGKGADGRIPIRSKILHLPYMIYSECVWKLARFMSRENPIDAVTDDLKIGRRLRVQEVPKNVVNYVDLTAETEDPQAIRSLPGYLALPILDASVPAAAALKATIARLRPGSTFVHCAQGHGRTGLFALALLAERRCIASVDEGMALIKAARPGVRLNRTQEAFIGRYIAEHVLAADELTPDAET